MSIENFNKSKRKQKQAFEFVSKYLLEVAWRFGLGWTKKSIVLFFVYCIDDLFVHYNYKNNIITVNNSNDIYT